MSKSKQVTEKDVSHGERLAENTAILEHVDVVLSNASREIRSGNNDKACKLVQLAQRATREAGKQITKHSKRMSGVPMSRVSVNQRSMEVHNRRLMIWKRFRKRGETAVRTVEEYVRSIEIEKDEKENGRNKRAGEMTSDKAKELKDASEVSPLKKKRDLKATPTKPAKSTVDDDDDNEEDSHAEPRQLFEHDIEQLINVDDQDSHIVVAHNPWPNVMHSHAICANGRLIGDIQVKLVKSDDG